MTGKVTIIAAVVQQDMIVLYDETGSEIVLKPTEYRTQEIMDFVLPRVSAHRKAVIDLSDYSLHSEFTKKSGGLVRFFRVVKSIGSALFGKPQDNWGDIARTVVPGETIPVMDYAPPTHEDVIRNAKPHDHNVPLQANETIIAVVEVEGQQKAIPHMEKLEPQLRHAAKSNSTEGMTKFLQRLGAVIDKRGHSVEDLLKFLEKADLPIADDGTVIGYKVLKSETYDDKGPYMRDCYTGRVRQRVGSYVFMATSLVDPDRRQSCSNGLHIARRDYLRGFLGDRMVLAKIAPEDFIAVPEMDGSKVRVSGYHILAELPQAAADLLRSGKPMTSIPEMAALLGAVLRGEHIGVIETVELKDTSAFEVDITVIGGEDPEVLITPAPTKKTEPVQAIAETIEAKSVGLSPKEVRAKADAVHAQEVERKEARKMDKTVLTADQEEAKKLLALGFMTKAQIAERLSTSTRTLARWIDKYNWTVKEVGSPGTMTETQKKVQEAVISKLAYEIEASGLTEDELEAHAEKVRKVASHTDKPTKAEQARKLYSQWQIIKDGTKRAKLMEELKALKKSSKKSWVSLGFTNVEEDDFL